MEKKRILMVVTSNDRLGGTGGATGSWLEELAGPYFTFVDAGIEVVIASPQGGKAPLDPASLEVPWLTDSGRRFLADSFAMSQLERSAPLTGIDARDFDAGILIGGAGAAWDLPFDRALIEILEVLYRNDRIVAGVCHGVLGLTSARREDGRLLVAGCAVTGVSDEEERLAGYDKVLPMLPQRRMIELGARYSRAAAAFGPHVVRDGNLITGQNPASATPLALTMVALLSDKDRRMDLGVPPSHARAPE
jgi:putative intracellular protease/amidase